ncbi:nucleocapsid protein [Narangue virus]|uniref:Nucleocapsid protein n=1 Tax=Narangue virus TaxID=2689367 RepID=A0A6B9KP91_9VIRU|nr:nucleocapsid protein [Narangue virus]QHA33859.1 nucleocapsid protein [Narangue virus]
MNVDESLRKLREKCCICLQKDITQKKPTWICSCTASVYKTTVLESLGKRGQQNLKLKEVPNLLTSKLIAEEKLRQIAYLNPKVLPREVVKGIRAKYPSGPYKDEIYQQRLPEVQSLSQNMSKQTKAGSSEQKPVEVPEVLSDELASTLEDALKHVDVALVTQNMLTIQDVFRYEGFDVAYIQKVFMTLFGQLDEKVMIEVAEGKPRQVSGLENIKGCISLLAFLYNYRGNNTASILDSQKEPNKKNLALLFNRLRIQDRVTETVDGKTKKGKATLTLSRLAAAFPLYSLNIIISDEYKRKLVDMSDFGINQDTAPGKVICHPLAASVLTKRMIENKYHYITFVAAVRLNSIIGPRTKKVDYERIWMFHKAGLNSKALTEKEKEEFWKTIGSPKFEMAKNVMKHVEDEYELSAQVAEEIAKFADE